MNFDYTIYDDKMAGNTTEKQIESEIGIKPDHSLQQHSASFDPEFNPVKAPRLALLYQVCNKALFAATHLCINEIYRPALLAIALRVKIWGLDLFDGKDCAPLHQVISPSMQRHLVGIWADIAAMIDLLLTRLITLNDDEVEPESYIYWRRLKIVLGLEDIASAVHDGLDFFQETGSDWSFHESSKNANDFMNSLQGMVDCLFDLLVTIGTTRQLHKLGHKTSKMTPLTSQSIEDTVGKFKNELRISSTPPSRVISVKRFPVGLQEPNNLRENQNAKFDELHDKEEAGRSEKGKVCLKPLVK